MKRQLIAIWLPVLTVMVCCSGSGGGDKKAGGKTAKPIRPASKTVPPSSARLGFPGEMQSTPYSDGKVWRNGINTQKPGMFFVSLPLSDRFPVSRDWQLAFEGAGTARVESVSALKAADGRNVSYFVTMDRKLDPEKDGFPHPIRVKSYPILAAAYSKSGEWRNGVHLTKPGMFFVIVDISAPDPVVAGSRLVLHGSGEAVVQTVASMPDGGKKKRLIFITVNKALNPDQDGHPYPVRCWCD